MPSLPPMQNYQQWDAFFKKGQASGALPKLPRNLRAETLAIGADFHFQAYRRSDQAPHLQRALDLWKQAMALVPETDPLWKPYGLYNYLLALWDQCQQSPLRDIVERGLKLSSQLMTDKRTSPADRRTAQLLSGRFSLERFEADAAIEDLARAASTLICCDAKEPGCDNNFAKAMDIAVRKLRDARDQLLEWPELKHWLAASWRDIAALQPDDHVVGVVVLVDELLKLTCEFGDIPSVALSAAQHIFDDAPEDWKAVAAGHGFLVLGMAAKSRHENSQGLEDLDCAIDSFERAIASADCSRDGKAEALLSLAQLLMIRYANRPAEADLDRMVEAAELAGRFSESDSDLRDASRMKRITTLFRDTLRDTRVDLPEADFRQTLADALRSTDPEAQCAEIELLGGIALAAGCLYERTGRIDLLERAVAIATVSYSQALASACDKHAAVVPYARALVSRYDRARDDLDLDNALLALRSVDPDKAATISIRQGLHRLLADALHHDISRTANWNLLDQAKHHYQAALDLNSNPQEEIGLQEKLAATLFHKARTVGSDDDARQALDLFEDAWQRNRDPKLTGHLARSYGTSLLKFVEDSSDAAAFDKAITLLATSYENTAEGSVEYPIVTATLMYAHQRRFEEFGDPQDLRRSIAVGEAALMVQRRRNAPDIRYRIGDQAVWYRVYESLVEAYMSLSKIDADRAAATRRAFEIAEVAKQGLFLNLFGNGAIDPAIAANFFRKDSDVSGMISQTVQKAMYGSPLGKSPSESVELTDPIEMTWPAALLLFQHLSPQTAILSCFLGQRRSWWFLLSSDATEPLVIESALGRLDWQEILQRMFNELISPKNIHAEETWPDALSDLADFGAALRSFRRLVISNHQMTSCLAWNALSRRLHWRSIDDRPMSISTVPNLRFLARSRETPTPSLPPVVIGDPQNDLVHAAAEACAVADLFNVMPLIGSEATVQAVTDHLQDRALLHFAGHGQFHRDRDPVALRLADGELSARDILKSRLSAKLVVLSACWSGVTSKVAREEYFGLAEAFLLAGADSVVVALWEVDDEIASEFFRQFYRCWQSGVAAADAVGDAMDVISSQPKWVHPHWWGGFVVRGFGGFGKVDNSNIAEKDPSCSNQSAL
jgi:tetratricopeptide (TPR) repeat protein